MKEDKAYIGDEIVEGNKLIAEFMGMKPATSGMDIVGWYGTDGTMSILGEYTPHKDWDEAMEVVEKIGELATFDTDGHDELYVKAGSVLSVQVCQPIELLWERIVEFIKWYNQNKQS